MSSANLFNKYVGKNECLVKNLFDQARSEKPSVVFFNNVDLMQELHHGGSEASNRIRAEFLTQMQKVGMVGDGILVLGATNVPWNLDTEIRRCFVKWIYTPLPDKAARKRMFELRIGSTATSLTSHDLDDLARDTEGYSCADICSVVVSALVMPALRLQNATHFKVVSGEIGTEGKTQLSLPAPCDPGCRWTKTRQLILITILCRPWPDPDPVLKLTI